MSPALERQSLASRIGAAGVYAAGAIVALASAYRANAGYSVLPFVWLLWIAGPYLALGLASDAIGRQPRSRACHRALLAASVAAFAFTVYVYQSIWRGPHHSTEGLVFLFAPAWIVFTAVVVFALALWLGRTAVKR
jgi:hypothetical protein